MKAKEKAGELVEKFRLNVLDYENNGLNSFKAKQCALIAVDEIIKEINDNYDTLHSADRKQYWKGIKKEIENL